MEKNRLLESLDASPRSPAKHLSCQTLESCTLSQSASTVNLCKQRRYVINGEMLGRDSSFEMTGVLPRGIFHIAMAPDPSTIQPVEEKERS